MFIKLFRKCHEFNLTNPVLTAFIQFRLRASQYQGIGRLALSHSCLS